MSSGERLQIGQFVTADGNVESHLNISSVHTNDGGLYTCVVSSKVPIFYIIFYPSLYVDRVGGTLTFELEDLGFEFQSCIILLDGAGKHREESSWYSWKRRYVCNLSYIECYYYNVRPCTKNWDVPQPTSLTSSII